MPRARPDGFWLIRRLIKQRQLYGSNDSTGDYSTKRRIDLQPQQSLVASKYGARLSPTSKLLRRRKLYAYRISLFCGTSNSKFYDLRPTQVKQVLMSSRQQAIEERKLASRRAVQTSCPPAGGDLCCPSIELRSMPSHAKHTFCQSGRSRDPVDAGIEQLSLRRGFGFRHSGQNRDLQAVGQA